MSAPPVTSPTTVTPPTSRRVHLLAALVLLGGALWAQRVMLPAPAERFPYLAVLEDMQWRYLDHGDQQFVAAAFATNARHFVTAPSQLFETGFCYPLRQPVTLGEHMFGEGLLAIVPWILSRGDPIVVYNVVLVLTLWIPGLAMYALVHHWTRHPGAALVAGLLFAFHPSRVSDPVHPMVHGDHWIPLALLFAHRLFVHRRWRDAAGLALFMGLQALGSFYHVITMAIVGGTIGVYLLARHWRALPAVVVKLAVVAATIGGLLALVMRPYLHTRDTWSVLGGRMSFLKRPETFHPGQGDFCGWVAATLAVVAILDRLRGARRTDGDDPRLALLAAATLAYWCSVWGLTVPGFGWFLPSPLLLLRDVVPGLNAVRALSVVAHGAYLGTAFLAGYGVFVLVHRRGAVVRRAIVAGLAALVLLESFDPAWVQWSYGRTVEMLAWDVRPPAELLAAYDEIEPGGAILDLPLPKSAPGLGEYVLLSAFHHHPVAACYNSFVVAVQDDLVALASAIPNPAVLDAFYALGFRAVVLHGERYPPLMWANAPLRMRTMIGRGLLPPRDAAEHKIYGLTSKTPVTRDVAALTVGAPQAAVDVTAPQSDVTFHFYNGTRLTFRHPDPIEPTDVVVRWVGAAGDVTAGTLRVLLPIALGPGGNLERVVTLPVSVAPGDYSVTLSPASRPELVVARQTVRVVGHAEDPR